MARIVYFVMAFAAAIVTRSWAEPEAPQTTTPTLNIDPQLRRALLQALTRLEKEAQEEAARLQEQDTSQSLDLPTASTPVRNEDFSSFATQQTNKNENTQLTQVTYDEELSTDSLNDQGTKPTQNPEFDNINFQGSSEVDSTTQLPDETRPNTRFELLPEKFDIQSNVISTTNGNEKPAAENFPSSTTATGVHSTESTITKNEDKSTVSTGGSPLLDENDREVSIFQAPLVAAFTLHHDLDGLPKRVVPLFRPKPTAATPTNERPFQPLTKQRELEQRTIQLQQQLFNIQKQQLEQQRFLKEQQQRQERLRQEQIFQEQERIRQQQLLQEQQRILQQQQQQQQQHLLVQQQQRQREINFQQPRQQFFQTDSNTPFFQQNQQPFFPIHSNQPAQVNQGVQPNSPIQVNQPIQSNQPIQTLSNNQPIQTLQNNQPNQPIQPIQPIQTNEQIQPVLSAHRFQISRPVQSVQPIQPIQTQHLRSQRQETGTAIVDFQKSLTFPLVPPPLPSSSFQTPPLFNSDPVNHNVFGQPSFQNFGNNEPFIPIPDNRHQFNPIDNQQSKVQTNFASTLSKFQKPPPVDKQLQNLLFQSGIARDLQSNVHNGASSVEDINILTKVLSLNHENEENGSKSQRSSRKTLESHHTRNVQHIQPPAIHLLAPHF